MKSFKQSQRRGWRMFPSLRIARKKSPTQKNTEYCKIVDVLTEQSQEPQILQYEDRDDDEIDTRKDAVDDGSANDPQNERQQDESSLILSTVTGVIGVSQHSNALDQNETPSTNPEAEVIVEERESVSNEKLMRESENDNDVTREPEMDGQEKMEESVIHQANEGVDVDGANQVNAGVEKIAFHQTNEVDITDLFTENTATRLDHDENESIVSSDSSNSSVTCNTIKTEYIVQPGIMKDEDTHTQSIASTSMNYTRSKVSMWNRLTSIFGLSGNDNEKVDDSLSEFVSHSISEDLKMEKLLGENLDDDDDLNKVRNADLLNEIDDHRKINRPHKSRIRGTATADGKLLEDSQVELRHSRAEAMLSSRDVEVETKTNKSRHLNSVASGAADNDLDSLLMDIMLDGSEVIKGIDSDESESDDTLFSLIARVFHCKNWKEQSLSFTPNSSIISDYSESFSYEEVPYHSRKRFEF